MTNTRNIAHAYKALIGLVNMIKAIHGNNLDRSVASGLDSVLGNARNLLKHRRSFETALHNGQSAAASHYLSQLNGSREALQYSQLTPALNAFSQRMAKRGNIPYAVANNLATAIESTIEVLILSAC